MDVASMTARVAATLIAGFLVSLNACSAGDSGTGAAVAAEHGGTLVVSVGGDPDLLLPLLTTTVTGKIVNDLVYDRLAEIGDSLSTVGDVGFEPRLAKDGFTGNRWLQACDGSAARTAFCGGNSSRSDGAQPVSGGSSQCPVPGGATTRGCRRIDSGRVRDSRRGLRASPAFRG